MELLTHYYWPGNVRELQNVIERCVILTSGPVLHRPWLPETKQASSGVSSRAKTLAEAEREHILETLQETDWVTGGPDGAAAKLAVKRTTLLDRIGRLGISRPQLT